MKQVLKFGGYFLAFLLFGIVVLLAVFFESDVPLSELKSKYTTANSQFIPMLGMQVHVRDEGPKADSIPMVLLHGMSSSLNTWDEVVNSVAGRKRTISVDLPGFGMTGPNPKNQYNFVFYNSFIDSLCAELGVEKFTLVGNSMGGAIAWNYDVTHPGRLNKLVLIDAAGYPKTKEKGSLGFLIASTPIINNLLLYFTPKVLVRKSLETIYFDQNLVTDAQVDRFHDIVVREGNRAAALEIFKGSFGKPLGKACDVKTPTLILWGEFDQVIDVGNADRFNQDIVGSKKVIFPKVGHVPMEEVPSKVADELVHFVGALK
jgi:pimeloyl-ACP methyl ester carboxylesterase